MVSDVRDALGILDGLVQRRVGQCLRESHETLLAGRRKVSKTTRKAHLPGVALDLRDGSTSGSRGWRADAGKQFQLVIASRFAELGTGICEVDTDSGLLRGWHPHLGEPARRPRVATTRIHDQSGLDEL
jgi:hypothetical protein